MRIEIRPAFDEAVRAAEKPVRLAAAKMLVLLQSIELPQQVAGGVQLTHSAFSHGIGPCRMGPSRIGVAKGKITIENIFSYQ